MTEFAKAATAAKPTYVDAFDTLGWIHYRRGEFAESLAALQKAKSLSGGTRIDIDVKMQLRCSQTSRRR